MHLVIWNGHAREIINKTLKKAERERESEKENTIFLIREIS